MTGKTAYTIRARGLLFLLVFVVFIHCRGQGPQPDTTPRVAIPAPFFNDLFSPKSGGWTGGDGTLSIYLNDGRTIWLFGDTLLGQIRTDGTRPKDTPMIRNSLVIQNGGQIETRYRRTGKGPSAFFAMPSARAWYWPGDGTVVNSHAQIFLHRFRLETPRLWGWDWKGTVLATLSLPDLEVERFDEIVSENGIMYGVSIHESDRYTYIYGTQDASHPKFAHLARAPTGCLSGPWVFYSGRGWSEDPLASAPILSGVSTQYSVFSTGGVFYLVTMDGRRPFPDTIVAYRAGSPSGPWQGPRMIYRVPGVDHNIIAYNPFVHTQFTEGNRYLVSYNLNHVNDPSALYMDASIYRPRFIRVDFAELERRFSSSPGNGGN